MFFGGPSFAAAAGNSALAMAIASTMNVTVMYDMMARTPINTVPASNEHESHGIARGGGETGAILPLPSSKPPKGWIMRAARGMDDQAANNPPSKSGWTPAYLPGNRFR